MGFEEAYEESLRQVQQIKSVLNENIFISVFGRDFRIDRAKGMPRTCQIWSNRDGKNGLVCVGTVVVSKCKSFQNVRERIANKIAMEIIKQ